MSRSRVSARVRKLQAQRRAKQLPKPDPAGAEESFRKLRASVCAAKEERINKSLQVIAYCMGAVTAILAFQLILR